MMRDLRVHGRHVGNLHTFAHPTGQCTHPACDAVRHQRPEADWVAHFTQHPDHVVVITITDPATCSCGAQAPYAFLHDARIYPPKGSQ